MNNTHMFLFGVLLSSGCAVVSPNDRDSQVVTETLTAADTEGAERPLIDLREPGVRWIVDGTEMSVDLGRIDIRDAGEAEPFSTWLVEDGLVDEAMLEELSTAQITIEPNPDVAEGARSSGPQVGQHELGLTKNGELQARLVPPTCQIFCYEKCDGGQCKTICMVYCS